MMALKEERGEENHHVLLVAFSAQGHLNPMLRLGKRLLSKGLHVTLATTEDVRHLMLKSSSAAAHSVTGITLDFFSDGLPLDFDRNKNIDAYVHSLRNFGPTNLSHLIRRRFLLVPHKLSCIIANPFVPWVAAVAAQHHIPAALLWIQPCTLYALYYRFYNNLNQFPTPSNPNMDVELPGLPLFRTEDLPSFVLPSTPHLSVSELLSDLFENMGKYKWVLANSFQELENDAIESMSGLRPVAPVGPLVPETLLGEKEKNGHNGIELWKPEDGCLEWLSRHQQSTVVYVSFGSITELSAKQMENVATALKNSNRPFLWVVKPSRHPSPGRAGELPRVLVEGSEGRGLVVEWCPQAEVLAHPAVACFVTHCGWNSTLEAVAAGVPVVAYPQWSDQPTNAKVLVDGLGVGVRLRPDRDGVVGSEELERCVEEIMGGERAAVYRKKAEELKEATQRAVAGGGSSDKNIQLFVDGIMGKLCSSV
ncbi:UDP-glycosyltransferase 84B2-like [Malania oleifera]|uniref:UDP-glycosyltransferase 84B2-like n=1 Tax=Malania oleifera TaxID=397392 RepID=UPI0025AE1FDA|nr:UDP-glycosyltransferase 84B2-like [Malania oleifera]